MPPLTVVSRVGSGLRFVVFLAACWSLIIVVMFDTISGATGAMMMMMISVVMVKFFRTSAFLGFLTGSWGLSSN